MTSTDTLTCAEKIYKQLTHIAGNREQMFAIIAIVNVLLNFDVNNESKPTE